jgi:hypothetical protein
VTESTRIALASRTFVRLLFAWAVPAGAVAAFVMYAAWQHNPQGEFHSAAGVDWKAWLGLGLVWFLGVLLSGLLLAGALRLAAAALGGPPSDPPAG